MLLEKLFRQTGYSLTEIMVAMGLLGGVSMVAIKLAQDNSANESYVRFKSEVAKATSIIQTHLSDPNSCKTMLVGKTRYTNPSIPTSNAAEYIGGTGQLTMVNKLGTATVVLLQHNRTYDGFQIPQGGILLATSKLDSSMASVTDLVIVFDIRNRDLGSRKNGYTGRIIKRIPIKTEMTGSVIKSCGMVIADANLDAKKQLCDSLTAGAATWDGTECRLNSIRCPYGQVPFQLTSLGSMKCIPVEQKIDASQIFNFGSDACAPGQSIRLINDGTGKMRADCY